MPGRGIYLALSEEEDCVFRELRTRAAKAAFFTLVCDHVRARWSYQVDKVWDPIHRCLTEGELEWLYRHARLVLFPTLYEGFGLPMVEAFAHGIPALASDIPTLREVGEGCARFVDPLDAGAWAAAVCDLSRDAAARESLVAAGRARAAELTYERTAIATLEVLREAVSSPRVAA